MATQTRNIRCYLNRVAINTPISIAAANIPTGVTLTFSATSTLNNQVDCEVVIDTDVAVEGTYTIPITITNPPADPDTKDLIVSVIPELGLSGLSWKIQDVGAETVSSFSGTGVQLTIKGIAETTGPNNLTVTVNLPSESLSDTYTIQLVECISGGSCIALPPSTYVTPNTGYDTFYQVQILKNGVFLTSEPTRVWYSAELIAKSTIRTGSSGGANIDSGSLGAILTSTTAGGSSSYTYLVTLRFKGIVELNPSYTVFSGTGSVNNTYATGGPTVVNPGYNPGGAVNVYYLHVSEPKSIYYLNKDYLGAGVNTIVDYTITIPVQGGATVSLYANGQDGFQLNNNWGVSLYGVTNINQPYNGQFLQMTVVDVSIAP